MKQIKTNKIASAYFSKLKVVFKIITTKRYKNILSLQSYVRLG